MVGVVKGLDQADVEVVVVENFACVEVPGKYWQHFVRETQYELDLDQIEIDELELAPELVVHQNQPSQNKHAKQNEFFLPKKCNGAKEYKRHCFSASNAYTLMRRKEMMKVH